MKKIYQIPETMVHMIAPATLVAESPDITIGDGEIEAGDVGVKGQRHSSDNYNVWNDDWSN